MTILQVGALPVRKSRGGFEILLISSRETGRWVIPKGWPSKRLSDPDAAAREAKQEAGVTGKISRVPVGSYRYRKKTVEHIRVLTVTCYVLWVKKERKRWREQDQRTRVWFSQEDAVKKVREPGLKILIASLEVRPKS
ncbi:NUDIX hydrolase [Hyphomicrobium facile]|uniref:ADP-ribose pyrophosphatase YjhB, NUDIX family n=1 Tax=Hyphomicrobium facile TaxID=51670 RepID=A0A1I7NQH3_9HYPH|nr:NUDIX hydrolase [Hyphomicrobium facile]SFV36934.1 ADP-ribose pyrophosphatase YjhB, NUDIX family [Hyphomicrobium facile]